MKNMLHTVLKPFASMISKLTYRLKFLLVSLLFLTLVAAFVFNVFYSRQADIDRIRLERVGVEQARQLMPVI